ncbi:T9SS type A sorting domain-containing protein, partial [Flavobacterium terrae]
QAGVDAAFNAWLAQFQTVNDGCSGTGGLQGQYAAPSLCEGGVVNVSYRIADNCTSDTASATFTLTAAQRLIVNCPRDIELTCGQDPRAEFNDWLLGFGFTGGCNPTATDLSGYEIPAAGQTLTITYIVSDNCNRESCTASFKMPSCNEPHCTYTQGYYGAYNGSACTVGGSPTTDYLIMLDAITDVGGTFDFGRIGTGNYFRLFLSDITGAANIGDNKIFKMLPGGGTPRALVGYDYYDNPIGVPSSWRNDNNPLTKSGPKTGAINNNLLSQTMTLFFNTHVDPTLVGFVLESHFATQDVACGSNVPIPDTYKEFSIPNSVINYLTSNGGATVGNLFNLANDALGGVNIGGLSHADVNKAVDVINNAFDQCRIRVPLQTSTFVYSSAVSSPLVEPIFTVYPVPFRDVINIKYDFDYSSKARIDIYDSKGMLLMSQDDNNAYLNKEISITPRFNRGEQQLFFIRVTTDRGMSTKKVISDK